ncbi:protein-lysine N-methyltransferase EFM4 [Podospora conica]|nr:protein-lysine N-methyltransferase EFM4 [Schizothecium conicum]
MSTTNNPPNPGITHLDPSELGTKQYWDALYTTELTNHAANPSDEGTVWFDDSDAESKVVEFLTSTCPRHPDYEPPSDPIDLGLDPDTARILDLGTGNGSLLLAVQAAGWGGASGRLVGVDYSAESVRLAREIQDKRREEDGEDGQGVEFLQWDVLNGPFDGAVGAGEWDLVLDKGTFDAISLSGERDASGRRICEGYGERVVRLLRAGGKFVVTSCNWTEEELRGWFEGDGKGLRQVARIEYPSFSFGGVKGQTISTLCFERVP